MAKNPISILYDSEGHAVSVVAYEDGYRLQTQASIDGYSIESLPVTQVSPPWAVAGTDADGAAPTKKPVLVAGYDGTNVQTTLTDSAGRHRVVGAAADGSTVTGDPILVGGQDGTNVQSVLTDTSGRQRIVGAGTNGAAVVGDPLLTAGVDGSGNVQIIKTNIAGRVEEVLYDSSGNAVGVVLDGAVYRLQTQTKIVRGSDGAQIDPATETTLALIKNTDGIKKITDALPTGDNRIGRIKVTDDTNVLGIDTANAAYVAGKSAVGAAPSSNPVNVSGVDGSGNKRIFLLDATGIAQDNIAQWFGSTAPTIGQKAMAASIPVTIASDNSAIQVAITPAANVFFRFGEITSTTTTTKRVEKTTYTEQTTNAQRSVASASANDAAAGTGARTVKITYLDQTGAGPYTETVTLNGTTGVNTAASDICFIEKLEVITVGSTGSNVGIITLYSAINKGGVTIGTIAAKDIITYWCHHYVPSGLSFKLTGISVSHNGTTVGSGAAFWLRSLPINVANVPEVQITDVVRLYGQSSTFSRLYNSPVTVAGPARITMFVTPESASSFVYRSAIDFYEE